MQKRTTSGDSLTQLVLDIFRLNGALLDAGNALTKPHGLTSARWQVMGAIDLAGTPLTVSQIARRMGLSRQAVQRIVNDLNRLLMIELQSNLDHRRAPLVALSPLGSKTLKAIDAAQINWVNNLSEGLVAKQIDDARRLLNDLHQRTTRNEIKKEKQNARIQGAQ